MEESSQMVVDDTRYRDSADSADDFQIYDSEAENHRTIDFGPLDAYFCWVLVSEPGFVRFWPISLEIEFFYQR